MSEENPFASWPHLNAPRAAAPAREEPTRHATPLERFLGGSPASVAVKLVFVSLVVGALLMWLDIRPMDIFRGIDNFIQRIYALGFGAVREILNYLLAGAAIVLPAWLILRLLQLGGRS
ncbi:MAG TPA: DUF6460 domain-containing protein [Methylocystis sp.]|nr:DUF6460 domain-containing protein [Methylocystis sp.]